MDHPLLEIVIAIEGGQIVASLAMTADGATL